MFFATVATIIHLHRGKVQSSSGNSIIFSAQARVLVFIFVIFVMMFTIFEWRLEIEVGNRSNMSEIGLQWIYCKIKTNLVPDPGYCPESRDPARIDYSRTYFESLLLSGLGFFIFFAFGLDMSLYLHWLVIFKLIWAREMTLLKNLVLFGKDPSVVIPRSGSSAFSKLNSRLNIFRENVKTGVRDVALEIDAAKL